MPLMLFVILILLSHIEIKIVLEPIHCKTNCIFIMKFIQKQDPSSRTDQKSFGHNVIRYFTILRKKKFHSINQIFILLY